MYLVLNGQTPVLTELWNLTGTHIHMANSSVGSHSYAQVQTCLKRERAKLAGHTCSVFLRSRSA